MIPLESTTKMGRVDLSIPPILYGSSCLGNLYEALPDSRKLAIVREWIRCVRHPVIDSAGKYGAGLALEMIRRCLEELEVEPESVLISNKLGWRRVPLSGDEPTFEPGAWVGLEHDAVQDIGYQGILDCYEQGCALLGPYRPRMVSVHDPDEYLAHAENPGMRGKRMDDVLQAYDALATLRRDGLVQAVGVGAKDWTVIREIARQVELDWVMLACSYTVYSHPAELVELMEELAARGIAIINSAVFHSGFLTGGRFFDYREPDARRDAHLFQWRERFSGLCSEFGVRPADACVQYGLRGPGVVAVALNTSKPERVQANVSSVRTEIPEAFWTALGNGDLL